MGHKPAITRAKMDTLLNYDDIRERIVPTGDEERQIWITAYLTALKSPVSTHYHSDPDKLRNFAQKCADVAVMRMRPLV